MRRILPFALPLLTAGFFALTPAQTATNNETAKSALAFQVRASNIYAAELYVEFYGLPHTSFDRLNENGTVIGTWLPNSGISPRAFLFYPDTEEIVQLFVPQSEHTYGMDVDNSDIAYFSSYESPDFLNTFQGHFSWSKMHGYRSMKGPEGRVFVDDRGLGMLHDFHSPLIGGRINLHSGKFKAFQSLPGYDQLRVHDINSKGDVIGWVGNSLNGRYVLWTQNGKPQDLGPASPFFAPIVNINDNGQFALPTPLGLQVYDGPDKPGALIPVPGANFEDIGSVRITNAGDIYVNIHIQGWFPDARILFQGEWYRANDILSWDRWFVIGIKDANAAGRVVATLTNFPTRVDIVATMRKVTPSP